MYFVLLFLNLFTNLAYTKALYWCALYSCLQVQLYTWINQTNGHLDKKAKLCNGMQFICLLYAKERTLSRNSFTWTRHHLTFKWMENSRYEAARRDSKDWMSIQLSPTHEHIQMRLARVFVTVVAKVRRLYGALSIQNKEDEHRQQWESKKKTSTCVWRCVCARAPCVRLLIVFCLASAWDMALSIRVTVIYTVCVRLAFERQCPTKNKFST